MVPLSALVARWNAVSQVPVFVGTVPEGTSTPYASLNVIQSNPVRLSSNVVAFTESILSFKAVADKLTDAKAIGEAGKQAFNNGPDGWGQVGASVLDMSFMNEAFDYSPQPTLTGNRPWMAIQEYRLRS